MLCTLLSLGFSSPVSLTAAAAPRTAQPALSADLEGMTRVREPEWEARMNRVEGGYETKIVWPASDVAALPSAPAADFSPEEVALALCAGIQNYDVPDHSDGMRRLYAFSTVQRKMKFGNFASLTELYALRGCKSFTVGEVTLLKGTATRQDTCSVAVEVEVDEQEENEVGAAVHW